MHNRIKLWFNLFFAGLLLFLFLVPRAYLNSLCDDIGNKAAQASAVIKDRSDVTAAAPLLSDMERIFESRAPVLRLFLTHGEVDALGSAIAVCAPLTEKAALLSGLNAVSITAEHLRKIEDFHWLTVF